MNCAHGPCDCQDTPVTQNGREYCSEDCANDARNNNADCHCPHSGCSGHH